MVLVMLSLRLQIINKRTHNHLLGYVCVIISTSTPVTIKHTLFLRAKHCIVMSLRSCVAETGYDK